MTKAKGRRKSSKPANRAKPAAPAARPPQNPSKTKEIPASYQGIHDYFAGLGNANPFTLRKETFRRIEQITGRPLICYVTKTHNLPQGVPAYIDDSDLTGFDDLMACSIAVVTSESFVTRIPSAPYASASFTKSGLRNSVWEYLRL